MPEHHGPPRPPSPIPDGKPNPHFEPHRARIAALRAAAFAASGRKEPPEVAAAKECAPLPAQPVPSGGSKRAVVTAAEEWASLPEQFRLFLLVFSGVDEPEDYVVARDWREMPPAERLVVEVCLRDLRERLGRLVVLTA